MSKLRIDIVSDAICPWCWIGKRNLEGALAELGWDAELTWHPYQLNPEMPPEGVSRAEYRAAKFGSLERSKELDAQVTAAGDAAGLEFRLDRQARTPNTLNAHRLSLLAQRHGVQAPVLEALFQAYFHDGEDVGDLAVLARIGAEHGLEAAEYLASDQDMEQIVATDASFRQGGISGVPSFALERHLLFSGAMPVAQMAAAFRRGEALLREKGLIGA